MTQSPPSPRTIAIGDIHGCATALAALLEQVQPQPDDVIVTLGDYIDRGPDSRSVVDQLIALAQRCRLVLLQGNHEEMLFTARRDRDALEAWLFFGGDATLQSYGPQATVQTLPDEHIAFLETCVSYHETATHFFVHANYIPALSLDRQLPFVLRWESLRDRVPESHVSGKIAMLGHTPQLTGDVLDLGHLLCVDTFCYGGGWLTAYDVTNSRQWQANQRGQIRDTKR